MCDIPISKLMLRMDPTWYQVGSLDCQGRGANKVGDIVMCHIHPFGIPVVPSVHFSPRGQSETSPALLTRGVYHIAAIIRRGRSTTARRRRRCRLLLSLAASSGASASPSDSGLMIARLHSLRAWLLASANRLVGGCDADR